MNRNTNPYGEGDALNALMVERAFKNTDAELIEDEIFDENGENLLGSSAACMSQFGMEPGEELNF